MKKTNRAIIALTCVGVLVLMVLRLTGSNREQIQRLPDGSALALRAVKFGRTNVFFVHATMLEKLLDPVMSRLPPIGSRFFRVVPGRVVGIGNFNFHPPLRLRLSSGLPTDTLSAEFRLIPTAKGASILQRPRFPRTLRWVIKGTDNVPYVQEFWDWNQKKDGLFTYISTSLFPRDVRQLSITIEERIPEAGEWHELARFSVKNPVPARIESWSAPQAPLTKHMGDMEFTLGETTFRLDPRNTNDIWDCDVEVPIQVRSKGVVETNWSADYFVFEDSSGNAGHIGALKSTTNGWLVYRTWYSPDPKYVWRINADFGLDSGWSSTNLCKVRLQIPWKGLIKTNFHGVPVEIDFVNGDMLAVYIPTNRTDLRLTFVGANDGGGPFRSGSWSQHRFWKELQLPPFVGAIEATFAVDRNYHVEFYTKPGWLIENSNSEASPRRIQSHP